ncbi:hypothetical protein [Pseudonocardia sp. H11422]|uniref:hypothetical protein n=1 Tax=Pseudonocardia sp. H11422 TaxID=2835866 RepID=UPI001BDC62CD|nr:hypothetical protein [Pseudonocardia sp. H11422]
MADQKTPPAPKGLGAAGRRLWRSVLADYELDQHECLILTEACRVADRLERLAEESEGAPLTLTNFKGDPVANPLLTEARQQAIVFARLIAALRLPTEEDNGARPQRRGAPRGVYPVRPWALSS